MTQTSAILAHLQTGETLTPLEALRLFGCFRLAARVHDIKESGYPVVTEWLTTGNGKRVARYRLLSEPVQVEMFGT